MKHLLPFLLVPIVLGVLFYFIKMRKATKNPPLPVNSEISLTPALWTIGPIIDGKNYSLGMPLHPVAEASGWSFSFPPSDGVHYVYTGGSVAGKSSISMAYEIVADALSHILPTQGDPPGKVRLYFQRSDDDWQRIDGRWWSSPVDLAAGTGTLVAKLTPDAWTNVMGMSGAQPDAGFADAVKNSGAVGLTFGGMFAGHGVFVSGGNAKFVLREYKVT